MSTSKDFSTIFEEYFFYQRLAFEKYGPQSIVWMEVGSFYEMYGLRHHDTGDIDLSLCPIVDVAEICNQLSVTDKHLTFSLQPGTPRRTVVMAGFRDYALERYAALAVEANYTVVVYKQDRVAMAAAAASPYDGSDTPTSTSTNANNNKKVPRILSTIYSPGTFLPPDTIPLTNHIMSIWLDVFSSVPAKANANANQTMVCGMSVVNIVTGKSMLFEYTVKPMEWIPATFDELERFLSIYAPSELIVLLPPTWSKDKEGTQVLQLASFLTGAPVHFVETAHSVEARRCQQQVYLQHVLTTTFRNDRVFQQCQEFHEYPTATYAYCYLLHFLKEHNPSLIDKIELPHFETGKKHMVLANHTLRQLNILSMGSGQTTASTTTSLIRRKFSSVADFTNHCKTASGKRQFYEQLVRPTFDENWLQQEYAAIDMFLHIPDAEMVLTAIRKCLQHVMDLENAQRNLVARKWTFDFVLRVYSSFTNVEKIYMLLGEETALLSYCTAHRIDEMVAAMLRDMERHFIVYVPLTANTAMLTNNNPLPQSASIFHRGIYSFVDELVDQKESNEQWFACIRQTLNRIMATCEKSNSQTIEYVRIHETEKAGMSLVMTKKRAQTLKAYVQRHIHEDLVFHLSSHSHSHSKVPSSMRVPMKDIHFLSSGSSNDEVTFPALVQICRELNENKERMTAAIQLAMQEYMQHFEHDFQPWMQHMIEFVWRMDILQSKTYLAKEYHYCRPTIFCPDISSDEQPQPQQQQKHHHVPIKSFVQATGLRHALIEHINDKEKYVANDIQLGRSKDQSNDHQSNDHQSKDHYNGILLYGTNAVGKTSLIRALGIAVIMAQAGMFVPATSFVFVPYRAIYSRILGNDNLFKGLSTFAVEMSELRVILHSADPYSLVLGDELCSGTETESALSLFTAGLSYLAKKNASFIFATHFHEIEKFAEIKALHDEGKLVTKHMAVHYDKEKDKLMYDRLLRDGPGNRMYGLEVAKSLHLPTDFLDFAYAIRNQYFPVLNGPLSFPVATKYNAKKVRGMCEMCQTEIATETHHIVEQRFASADGYLPAEGIHKNHLSNLMALCDACHAKQHHPEQEQTEEKEKEKEKVIVRRNVRRKTRN